VPATDRTRPDTGHTDLGHTDPGHADLGRAVLGTPPSSDRDERPLTPDEFNAAVAAVTSAFGDPTRREIYLFVRASRSVTATEVADRFELHPNVARHHLEKLTGGGYLTVDVDRPDAGAAGARPAGRPSKRYRTSEVDATLAFPPRRDDILANLLARALDLVGPDKAATMADEVGYEYGLALAAKMGPAEGHRSVRSALTTVADALTAHGFAAHAEARAGSLAIVSECCPFGDAAQQYPHVVCAVDRGMIRGMLAGLYGDTQPRFEESRPDGDAHCVARV
jgi:predicted ArsR family transcriptional regulator